MDLRVVLVELPLAQVLMTTRAAESGPTAPGQDQVCRSGSIVAPIPCPRAWRRRASTPRGVSLWALRLRASLSRWS